MRQAGRSLPEYRAARRRTSIVEACTKPDLVTELTLQPLRRYPVDAAVLFSDIVVPLRAAGIGVDIREGVGPVVEEPIRGERDLQRLRLEVAALPEPEREAIVLYYHQDLTYRDLALMLGVSVATVNARLTRARSMLRKKLTAAPR